MTTHPSPWAIFKQLTKEFWLPLLLAVGLVMYQGWNAPEYAYVKEFWVLFTTVAFFFAQWNRVAKQIRTETGLQGVEAGLKQTLTELRTTADNLEGFSTGGVGFCWISLPSHYPLMRRDFVVHVEGRFPQRDVQVRIVDLDRMSDPRTERAALDENSYSLDLLIPEHVRMIPLKSPDGIPRLPHKGFNIFFTAPNGSYTQLLRAVLIEGVTRSAIRVERNGKCIFEKIDEDFPRGLNGEVQWDDHTAPRRGPLFPNSIEVIRSEPKAD